MNALLVNRVTVVRLTPIVVALLFCLMVLTCRTVQVVPVDVNEQTSRIEKTQALLDHAEAAVQNQRINACGNTAVGADGGFESVLLAIHSARSELEMCSKSLQNFRSSYLSQGKEMERLRKDMESKKKEMESLRSDAQTWRSIKLYALLGAIAVVLLILLYMLRGIIGTFLKARFPFLGRLF